MEVKILNKHKFDKKDKIKKDSSLHHGLYL